MLHDGHVHGSCSDCASFVTVFPRESAFGSWGYCVEQSAEPAPEAVSSLRAAVLERGTSPFRDNDIGVFRSEEDDACDFWKHLE